LTFDLIVANVEDENMVEIKNGNSKISYKKNEFICDSIRRTNYWDKWYVPQKVFNKYLLKMQVIDHDIVTLANGNRFAGRRNILENSPFSFTQNLLIAFAPECEFIARINYQCVDMSLYAKHLLTCNALPFCETHDVRIKGAPVKLDLILNNCIDYKPKKTIARVSYFSSAFIGEDDSFSADWFCANSVESYFLESFKNESWKTSVLDKEICVLANVQSHGRKYAISKPLQGLLAMQTLFYDIVKDNY